MKNKGKTLQSMKEFVNEILDHWFKKYCDKKYEEIFKDCEILQLIDYDPHVKSLLRKMLYFALQVSEYKITQEYGADWMNHKKIFFDLCNKYTDFFVRKAQECAKQFSDHEKYQKFGAELFLCEFATILTYMPSQFDRYKPNYDFIRNQFEKSMPDFVENTRKRCELEKNFTTYIGIEKVRAAPCTQAEYIKEYVGGTPFSDTNEDGYIVQDGTKQIFWMNCEDFAKKYSKNSCEDTYERARQIVHHK